MLVILFRSHCVNPFIEVPYSDILLFWLVKHAKRVGTDGVALNPTQNPHIRANSQAYHSLPDNALPCQMLPDYSISWSFSLNELVIMVNNRCGGRGRAGTSQTLAIVAIYSSWPQISRNFVCPYHPFYLPNRFEILQRERQYHCRALCKTSKRLGNGLMSYGQTKSREIWVLD